MRIVSILSKLFKTVGLLAVRLDLTKLRLKNWKEKSYFWLKSESYIFEQNRNPIFAVKMFFNFFNISQNTYLGTILSLFSSRLLLLIRAEKYLQLTNWKIVK